MDHDPIIGRLDSPCDEIDNEQSLKQSKPPDRWNHGGDSSIQMRSLVSLYPEILPPPSEPLTPYPRPQNLPRRHGSFSEFVPENHQDCSQDDMPTAKAFKKPASRLFDRRSRHLTTKALNISLPLELTPSASWCAGISSNADISNDSEYSFGGQMSKSVPMTPFTTATSDFSHSDEMPLPLAIVPSCSLPYFVKEDVDSSSVPLSSSSDIVTRKDRSPQKKKIFRLSSDDVWHTILFNGGKSWDQIPRYIDKLDLEFLPPEMRTYQFPNIALAGAMSPLFSFRRLRSLRLTRMTQSFQEQIWQVVWMNPELRDLELGMVLRPCFRRSFSACSRSIRQSWAPTIKDKPSNVYRGCNGKGTLHHSVGVGEYLDKLVIARAKIRAHADGYMLQRLPIERLTLTGFVVDAGPFVWFDPKLLKSIHFKSNCLDAGFSLPTSMSHVAIEWSQSPVTFVNFYPVAKEDIKLVNIRPRGQWSLPQHFDNPVSPVPSKLAPLLGIDICDLSPILSSPRSPVILEQKPQKDARHAKRCFNRPVIPSWRIVPKKTDINNGYVNIGEDDIRELYRPKCDYR